MPLTTPKTVKKKANKEAKMVVLKLRNQNYGKWVKDQPPVWEPIGGFGGNPGFPNKRGAPMEDWVPYYDKYDDVRAWMAVATKKWNFSLWLMDTNPVPYMGTPQWAPPGGFKQF